MKKIIQEKIISLVIKKKKLVKKIIFQIVMIKIKISGKKYSMKFQEKKII